jgi:hypothetical protein
MNILVGNNIDHKNGALCSMSGKGAQVYQAHRLPSLLVTFILLMHIKSTLLMKTFHSN